MKRFNFSKKTKSKGFYLKVFNYGTWALQTIEYGYISKKQIEVIKQLFLKKIKKFNTFKFNITLNKIFTKKPLDSRLGGGKGLISEIKSFIKPGTIILEVYKLPPTLVFTIFRLISFKLPLKLKIIKIK